MINVVCGAAVMLLGMVLPLSGDITRSELWVLTGLIIIFTAHK